MHFRRPVFDGEARINAMCLIPASTMRSLERLRTSRHAGKGRRSGFSPQYREEQHTYESRHDRYLQL